VPLRLVGSTYYRAHEKRAGYWLAYASREASQFLEAAL
jgi:hypothetical protein